MVLLTIWLEHNTLHLEYFLHEWEFYNCSISIEHNGSCLIIIDSIFLVFCGCFIWLSENLNLQSLNRFEVLFFGSSFCYVVVSQLIFVFHSSPGVTLRVFFGLLQWNLFFIFLVVFCFAGSFWFGVSWLTLGLSL